MIKRCKGLRAVGLLLLVVSFRSGNVEAQEKIKLSYSALDSAAIWYVALVLLC